MNIKLMKKGTLSLFLCLLLTLLIVPAGGICGIPQSAISINEGEKIIGEDITLPPPLDISMILEETVFRRCSIREFSTEPITIEHLSTILWAAYGYRDDGSRTIPLFQIVHGATLYVLIKNETMKLDVYRYDPLNHSLNFLKQISSFNFGQYSAPVYLGLVWDSNKSKNEYLTSAEIGMIGQNIAFAVNALDLGTVVNADMLPGAYLARIGLSPQEIPLILMPLGHPFYPYDFRYRPLDLSFLPSIQYSTMTLMQAIKQRNESQKLGGQLTSSEEYQMIWSTYGYSYLLDRMESEFIYHIGRHRTVPSAHGYYPLRVYGFTETRVYEYYPNLFLYFTPYPLIDFLGLPIFSYLKTIIKDDYRDDLAAACGIPDIANAPLSIVLVVDLNKTRPQGGDDFSGDEYRWMWYHEAGAATFNVLLEATAWDLSSTLVPLTSTNKAFVTSLLGLNTPTYDPLFIIPLGA